MVRTILWLVIAGILLPLISRAAFSEDSLPQVDRLGLLINSPSRSCRSFHHSSLGTSISSFSPQAISCTDSTGDYSLSRFNFVVKQEPFNLQSVRDMSSLASQGGSRIEQASDDIPLIHEFLTAGVQMVYRDPLVASNSATPLTNRMGAQVVLKGAMSDMKYQAEYGYSGQETGATSFAAPHDQIGGKFVWEWSLPFVTPQVLISRFTSNVDGDVTRAQTVANLQQFELDQSRLAQPGGRKRYICST